MLDEQYLVYGLDALSRAHAMNYFNDGHRGAAIIAGYYLCRECGVEVGVADEIRALIEKHWQHTPLCEPFPDEEPNPALLSKVADSLEQGIGPLREAGHNVIFASLALKALHQRPDLITPARIDGICRLIEAVKIMENLPLDSRDDIPSFDGSPAAVNFVLSELLNTFEAFEGRGQGWSGHLLTFTKALADIRSLGYSRLAEKGQSAFECFVRRIRTGPQDTDRVFAEHTESPYRPRERQYWQRRKDEPVGIGHCIKYPYGFYGLMQLADDTKLTQECESEAYHIF